jgi:hypothetical protein
VYLLNTAKAMINVVNSVYRPTISGISFSLKKIVAYNPDPAKCKAHNRADLDVDIEDNPYCNAAFTDSDSIFYKFAEADHSSYCLAYFLSFRTLTAGNDLGIAFKASKDSMNLHLA